MYKTPSKKKFRIEAHENKTYLMRALLQNPRPVLPVYWAKICWGYLLESLVVIRTVIELVLILLFAVGIVAVCIVVPKGLGLLHEYSVDAQETLTEITRSDFAINESSFIYDSDGKLIASVHEDADTGYLDYEDIPEDVINAFVAIEDRTFWENDGVDYSGIMRVGIHALASQGGEIHGASTITQQLVRNNFLTREVSITRKLKEIYLARGLTSKFSKEDIMEFYVNDICYANGIYGISGAAKAYFNCSVDELSLSQIAYLCAIPNRPSYYDPYINPERAIDRRDKVLRDMQACGFISGDEMDKAIAEKIVIERPEKIFNDYETTFAVDCVIRYFMKLDGFEFVYKFDDMDAYYAYHFNYNEEYEKMRHKLYTGGYKIYTTLDSNACTDLQAILDEQLSFNEKVDEETGIYQFQGAITAIDNSTGKVIAVVGGRSQDIGNQVYSFNRAYQGYRQPGSTIKPLVVYTPALERGYTERSTLQNISVTEAKKKGVDAQRLSGESMSLRSALVNSKNGCAWQLFDRLGADTGLSYLEAMGYDNLCPNDYYDSAALGGLTFGVTTVEQASAYCSIANHGVFREPTCIKSIIDTNGNEVWEDYESVQVYKAKAADDIIDILKDVLKYGTAARSNWASASKIEAFAKTGTTNGSKDGWLCGATPYYTVSVWVGYDTPQVMNSLMGNTYPLQIWKASMLSLTDGLEPAKFEKLPEYDEEDLPVIEREEGYYSYLPGRDDSEVLSDGYTVADYREDRVIGESVYAIIAKINSGYGDIDSLYAEGCRIIKDQIYSRKYTAEMQGYLDAAYNARKLGVSE